MKPPCARPVEIWPMDRPKPHPDNPRTHSGEQVAQIAKSIETFEALRPIVVDEQDYILAGHGIWLAHRQLQRQEIAVAVVDHLTEPQKRAFLIADNQIALNSAWDEQKLGSLIATLERQLEDVSVLGFEPQELDRLLADLAAEQGFVGEDEVPLAPVRAVSLPGDVWTLGKHRLLCGDATQAESLSKLLQGQAADMVFGTPLITSTTGRSGRGVRTVPRSQTTIWARSLSSSSTRPVCNCWRCAAVPCICVCRPPSSTPYRRPLSRPVGTGRPS